MHDKFLAYFDAVAQHGSIRKAAVHLNVSSSSVNRKIIAAEERFGVRLFDRHAEGVELTAAGAVVLEHCRRTLFDYRKTMSVMDDIRELRTGHIDIATLDSVALSILPDVLERFSNAYPQISFTIRMAEPSNVADSVAEGRADIGITFTNDLRTGVRPYTEKSAPIGAIMRPDHPLAGRDRLLVDDLTPFHVVRSYDGVNERSLWTEAMTAAGVAVPTHTTTNSLPLARSLILRMHCIGIYTKIGFLGDIEDGKLHYIPIQSQTLNELKIGIIISARTALAQPSNLLCRSLSKALRALRLDS